MHRRYKRLKLGGGQAYSCSSDTLPFQSGTLWHNLLQKPALTDVLHIFCINVIHCSKVTKHIWCS
jgi:hypothetical protein